MHATEASIGGAERVPGGRESFCFLSPLKCVNGREAFCPSLPVIEFGRCAPSTDYPDGRSSRPNPNPRGFLRSRLRGRNSLPTSSASLSVDSARWGCLCDKSGRLVLTCHDFPDGPSISCQVIPIPQLIQVLDLVTLDLPPICVVSWDRHLSVKLFYAVTRSGKKRAKKR